MLNPMQHLLHPNVPKEEKFVKKQQVAPAGLAQCIEHRLQTKGLWAQFWTRALSQL